MINQLRDDRQLCALKGLSFAEFERLLPVFRAVYEAERQKRYEQAVQAGRRRRKPGGGRKSKRPTMADKLLFVLYYYKVYPTFDQLGTQFDLVGDPSGAKAHERLYELSPLLHETLVRLEMMPKRTFQRVEELMQVLDGIDEIIIDATERAYRRPQEVQQQQAHYSGKKTAYPEEHAITTTAKIILFVGQAFSGHHHDYAMLKAELPPDDGWFAAIKVLVDLGYLGIGTDYVGTDIRLPSKKPRKSQHNPQSALTPDQKSRNRAISQVRIAIEHAIAGSKRYNILVHRFRNRRANFHDEVIALCAGLWNFALIY